MCMDRSITCTSISFVISISLNNHSDFEVPTKTKQAIPPKRIDPLQYLRRVMVHLNFFFGCMSLP